MGWKAFLTPSVLWCKPLRPFSPKAHRLYHHAGSRWTAAVESCEHRLYSVVLKALTPRKVLFTSLTKTKTGHFKAFGTPRKVYWQYFTSQKTKRGHFIAKPSASPRISFAIAMSTHPAEHHRKHEHDHVDVILHNRVPEVEIIFWIIKILSTTTGETFADYLNETVGLGLANTTYIILSFWIVALAAEFYVDRYNAFVYWLVVVLTSILGTLVTDNLTDGLGLELWISTIIFSVLLFITFGAWYLKEGTLDIHTIFTREREAFYWVAIFCTFALGTAGGDLITEGFGLGYWVGVVLFGGLIALVTAAWYFLEADGILCFWIAYILTRPLGASIGDLLSQDRSDGGLGLGTTVISIIFLVLIIGLATFLYIKVKRERQAAEAAPQKAVKQSTVEAEVEDEDGSINLSDVP